MSLRQNYAAVFPDSMRISQGLYQKKSNGPPKSFPGRTVKTSICRLVEWLASMTAAYRRMFTWRAYSSFSFLNCMITILIARSKSDLLLRGQTGSLSVDTD